MQPWHLKYVQKEEPNHLQEFYLPDIGDASLCMSWDISKDHNWVRIVKLHPPLNGSAISDNLWGNKALEGL